MPWDDPWSTPGGEPDFGVEQEKDPWLPPEVTDPMTDPDSSEYKTAFEGAQGGTDWGTTGMQDDPGWPFKGPQQSEGYESFAEELYRQAMGEGPSAAEAQLKREAEAGARRALALGKSIPGLTDAARLRMAQMASADMQASAQAQAVQARIEENARARQAYAEFLEREEAATIAREKLYMESMLERERIKAGIDASRRQQESAQLGAGLQAAGTAIAAFASLVSDKRAKTKIKKTPKPQMDEFLDALQESSTWQYKKKAKDDHPEATTTGRSVGPMAQDIAATKLGKDMVVDLDGTLALSPQKILSATLAGLGRVNERLKALEE